MRAPASKAKAVTIVPANGSLKTNRRGSKRTEQLGRERRVCLAADQQGQRAGRISVLHTVTFLPPPRPPDHPFGHQGRLECALRLAINGRLTPKGVSQGTCKRTALVAGWCGLGLERAARKALPSPTIVASTSQGDALCGPAHAARERYRRSGRAARPR